MPSPDFTLTICKGIYPPLLSSPLLPTLFLLFCTNDVATILSSFSSRHFRLACCNYPASVLAVAPALYNIRESFPHSP